MGIKAVLEDRLDVWEPLFSTDLGGKYRLKVHCSCGNNFEIKEKFRKMGDYIRPKICKKCKDITYLKYRFDVYYYSGNEKIVVDLLEISEKPISIC